MQHPATHDRPHSLAPGVRVGLAAVVALALAGVLGVATSASRTAVRHMSAQLQDGKRDVKLPTLEIVGRRAVAMHVRGTTPASSSAAAGAAVPGCVQPS